MEYTSDQLKAIELIKNFLSFHNKEKFFILQGSAGTGKTTLVKEIVNSLSLHFDHVSVTAPTHKAARVLKNKTGIYATTIHSLIYKVDDEIADGKIRLIKKSNTSVEPVLYIVDEASMISDRQSANGQIEINTPLLTDFIEYVLHGHVSSKMLFVGDCCQLPPVGYQDHENSPSLDLNYINTKHKLPGSLFQLKEVVRQAGDSYILKSANKLRDHILYNKPLEPVQYNKKNNAYAAMDTYMQYFDEEDDTVVSLIATTNMTVNRWNKWVRDKRHFTDLPLQAGDLVIIDRGWSNNEHLLIRGDTARIIAVSGITERFAQLNFMNVTLRYISADGELCDFESLYLFEHLQSEKGWLTHDQERNLIHEAMRCNPVFRDSKYPADDKYVNALRLRYGYALTGHKAQGSEYRHVIIHPYRSSDNPRWLYTAVTRAKEGLYSY